MLQVIQPLSPNLGGQCAGCKTPTVNTSNVLLARDGLRRMCHQHPHAGACSWSGCGLQLAVLLGQPVGAPCCCWPCMRQGGAGRPSPKHACPARTRAGRDLTCLYAAMTQQLADAPQSGTPESGLANRPTADHILGQLRTAGVLLMDAARPHSIGQPWRYAYPACPVVDTRAVLSSLHGMEVLCHVWKSNLPSCTPTPMCTRLTIGKILEVHASGNGIYRWARCDLASARRVPARRRRLAAFDDISMEPRSAPRSGEVAPAGARNQEPAHPHSTFGGSACSLGWPTNCKKPMHRLFDKSVQTIVTRSMP